MAAQTRFTAALHRIGTTTPLAEAARIFAQHGVPVFPCAPDGKQPITAHGFKDATADAEQVQSWWRRFPEANIGMPTGAASGVVVVDVDVHGANGYEGLNRADRAGLVSGWETQVQSPSGGLHLYFPATVGSEQRSWQAGRVGVDFRGDRGYIITPPSYRTVGSRSVPYRITELASDAGQPVDADRLRRFLDPPKSPRKLPVTTGRAEGWADARKIADWLVRQDNDRNLKLFWASCRLAENGVPYSDALDALAAVAQPDFGQREIIRTVTSAYRTISAGTPISNAVAEPDSVRTPLDSPASSRQAMSGRRL